MQGIAAACIGRLGSDAELKYTAQGKPILKWSMVVSNPREQERGRPDEWIRCAAFGERAEALAESGHLRKGCEVYAEGTLTVSRWESSDGPRSGLELAAFVVQPLAAFKRPAATNGATAGRQPAAAEVPF